MKIVSTRSTRTRILNPHDIQSTFTKDKFDPSPRVKLENTILLKISARIRPLDFALYTYVDSTFFFFK